MRFSAALMVRPPTSHVADQRIGDRAAFGDARVEREVRVLEDDDADRVARPERVVDVGVFLSDGNCSQ